MKQQSRTKQNKAPCVLLFVSRILNARDMSDWLLTHRIIEEKAWPFPRPIRGPLLMLFASQTWMVRLTDAIIGEILIDRLVFGGISQTDRR